jgi:hypothetical protein
VNKTTRLLLYSCPSLDSSPPLTIPHITEAYEGHEAVAPSFLNIVVIWDSSSAFRHDPCNLWPVYSAHVLFVFCEVTAAGSLCNLFVCRPESSCCYRREDARISTLFPASGACSGVRSRCSICHTLYAVLRN